MDFPSDLCDYPAGQAPDNTLPNFNTSDTLVPVLIPVCTILAVLAICFTAGRLFANRRKLRFSDYLIFVALILSLAHTGLMFAQTKYARHQWDVRACWYDGTYTKLLFAQAILLNITLFCSKTSIFLLFYQIFEIQDTMRLAIIAGIISCGLIYGTSIPLNAILEAPHVGETWISVLTSGRPLKNLIWGVVQAVLSVCLDLYIFGLPIPSVLRLNLTTRRKIQVLAVFATGLVAVVASILSLVYRVEAIDTNDGTWKYTALVICSVVENDIAIIISNVPGMLIFSRVYVSHLGIVRSLRTLLRLSGSFKSFDDRDNPNKPRTKGSHGPMEQDLDLFTDSDIRGKASIGMTRTFDTSQEANGPSEQAALSSLEAQATSPYAARHHRESGVHVPERHAGETSVSMLVPTHEIQSR